MISTINKPHGAFKCRSSTLVVFVDSGPFHGLLLTFLGSQSDFHGCRTPRCAYVSVINNRSFGRFWPVSWTITQFCGHVVISTTDEHQCVYVSVINICSFGRFWPVSWTITHRFGVPKRFPWLSNSKVRLRVGHQQSQFGPILARFFDYYSILGSLSCFHY